MSNDNNMVVCRNNVSELVSSSHTNDVSACTHLYKMFPLYLLPIIYTILHNVLCILFGTGNNTNTCKPRIVIIQRDVYYYVCIVCVCVCIFSYDRNNIHTTPNESAVCGGEIKIIVSSSQ